MENEKITLPISYFRVRTCILSSYLLLLLAISKLALYMLFHKTIVKFSLCAFALVVTSCKMVQPHSASDKFTPEKNEILPPVTIPCFAGAYYRKAVSSFDVWTGITGTVVTGKPTVDEARLDEKTKQPLDNFSVYMGGSAGGQYEVDAGLTWAFTQNAEGKFSEGRNAWRPFWRTKVWNNAPLSEAYTWYPGDTVRMEVRMTGPKKLRLVIADAGVHPTKSFSVDFDADGFLSDVKRQFKRVNAIDQFHNEGKPVKPTDAKVLNAQWLGTKLFRGKKELPMNIHRFTDMRCSDASHIVVTPIDEMTGAEKIDIFGRPKAD
jgi:hypothetical protein